MVKEYQEKMDIQGYEITVISKGDNEDYISLTDIAKKKDGEYPSYAIQNWLRSKNTLQFLGVWEHLNNIDFNSIEFDGIIRAAYSVNQSRKLQCPTYKRGIISI